MATFKNADEAHALRLFWCCLFQAVRVSDIGAAEFTDCTFANNYASGKGGAIVTQIENPAKNAVVGGLFHKTDNFVLFSFDLILFVLRVLSFCRPFEIVYI
jgi:predicted outer membrane repeat protein